MLRCSIPELCTLDHGNGANMQVANEIRLRGTPTFIWRNRDGSEGRLEGVANDFGALIAELNPHKPGRPSHCYHTHMMSTLRLVLSVDVQACDQHNVKHASDGLWSLLDRLEPDAGQPRLGCREAAVPELAAIIAKRQQAACRRRGRARLGRTGNRNARRSNGRR